MKEKHYVAANLDAPMENGAIANAAT